MRCYCCNKVLSSQEATRRFKESGEFADMCNECLSHIEGDVEVTDGYQEPDDEQEKED
jgi:hypothetical protein